MFENGLTKKQIDLIRSIARNENIKGGEFDNWNPTWMSKKIMVSEGYPLVPTEDELADNTYVGNDLAS